MSGFDELAHLDATAQAELIRKKEVTSVELVEAAIERIEKVNPILNAVITPMYDEARRAAAEPKEDPFAGVPILMKDLGAMYGGVRTTMGSKFLMGFVPDQDSELTIRLKKAGVIVLGKTNLPEFGLVPTTEPEAFGPTKNPWDIERTPGGSSGGSAAAVASGMVPMAHGNDGGGSIRIPSSCCGVFGLKPTRARNPLGPNFGDLLSGFVAEHALTRSVRDSAALLDATSGPDLGDPYWAPPPARPFLEEVGADPGKLRIAFTTQGLPDQPVDPDCQAAVDETVKLLQELGHEVEEAFPVLDQNSLAWWFTTVWAAGAASTVDALTGKDGPLDMFEPATQALAEIGRKNSSGDYLFAMMALQGVARVLAHFQTTYDLVLTPTLGEPPVPLGTFNATPEDPLAGWSRSARFAPFTPLVNATGAPAMSVPMFWNKNNLPIGVHFIGRFGDEATLFRLASQLEAARPWKDRRPAVFAVD